MLKQITRIALVTACSGLLLACQSMPSQRNTPVSEDIQSTFQEGTRQQATPGSQDVVPPAAVSEALLPPLSVEVLGVPGADKALVERRFDITVNRAPAKTFFMSLVQDTPYNMVTAPDLDGSISLSLKNVTIDEVMETVRNVYGYEYRRTGTGYEVMQPGLRSQVFKVDYLNVKRASQSQLRVSSGQVSQSQENGGTVSGSQVNTQSESDFWSELRVALSALIGDKEGRQVVINAQSGIVVVRAMPVELRAVADYLDATQNVIQRQVILEAKILEVALSDGFQSGINWSALGREGSNTMIAGQFGGSTIPTTGFSNLKGQTDALNPANTADIRADVASAFGGMFAMSLDLGDFTGFVEFLKTQGDVQVLSSPRVSTVNNQKAVIKVGTDEFFVTDVDTQTSSTTSGTDQAVDVELTPFFSGVALDVIPQISGDGIVTLHIHPSVSEVTEKVKEISLTATNQLSIPLALSTIRESDSIVRARNGQVVVIGGLMQNQDQDKTASVPGLGDLPMVGGLFRNKQKIKTKSELVILLRPVVIDGDQTWRDEVSRASGSFDALLELKKAEIGKEK